MTTLRDRLHFYAQFTDEESEAKRGCSGGCSCSRVNLPLLPAFYCIWLGPFPPAPPVASLVFPAPQHWKHLFWEVSLWPQVQNKSPFLELVSPLSPSYASPDP